MYILYLYIYYICIYTIYIYYIYLLYIYYILYTIYIFDIYMIYDIYNIYIHTIYIYFMYIYISYHIYIYYKHIHYSFCFVPKGTRSMRQGALERGSRWESNWTATPSYQGSKIKPARWSSLQSEVYFELGELGFMGNKTIVYYKYSWCVHKSMGPMGPQRPHLESRWTWQYWHGQAPASKVGR